MKKRFAVYFHDEICSTSIPVEEIEFVGNSFNHFCNIRKLIKEKLRAYPVIPLRKAPFSMYYKVHDKIYLDKIIQMSKGVVPEEYPKLSMECTGLEHCLPGFQYCLGGMLEAIDQMKKGELNRAYIFNQGGHHAHRNSGHGYCMVNSMAAAIPYANEIGFEKILIVDWDIHHGDGTQDIFENSDSVYCISIHSAVDMYMAKASDITKSTTKYAQGENFCNIPVLDNSFSNEFYKDLGIGGKYFRTEGIFPALRDSLSKLPFYPDMIFVFAGYDGHKDDCGKGITNYSNEDFQKFIKIMLDFARPRNTPIIAIQGGGYNTETTVSASLQVIKTFMTSD
ncbi:MAG: histone deacetylase [Bacteroidota bacterium]|nr:histone deacetylase [Bacteroidota bacterium]